MRTQSPELNQRGNVGGGKQEQQESKVRETELKQQAKEGLGFSARFESI